MKKYCFTFLLTFLWGILNSQTTTIDYLTSGLSTSACNVFISSPTINTVQHFSHAGGVSFNSSNGIGLVTSPQTTPSGGTAFGINYNFIPGYNYNISITASGNTTLLLRTSVVPNLNQFSTNGTSSCTTDPNVSSYQTAGVGRMSTSTSTFYTNL